jgi:hypothetical protein
MSSNTALGAVDSPEDTGSAPVSIPLRIAPHRKNCLQSITFTCADDMGESGSHERGASEPQVPQVATDGGEDDATLDFNMEVLSLDPETHDALSEFINLVMPSALACPKPNALRQE